jgi:regulatory protein
MPRVTQVERQKKNPQRFNIFLDGVFAFGADEDLVVNFRLLPGKEFPQSDLEKLLYEAEVGKLMERMYRLFNVRQRSEREVRDYFRKLNFKRKMEDWDTISDLVVDQVIERLKRKSMINDEAFARSWVDARRRSKRKGSIAIKAELMQKGVDREVINQVLSEEVVDEVKMALESLEKKSKNWQSLPDMEFKKKAYQYLLRQGFEYGVVVRVVEKIVQKG